MLTKNFPREFFLAVLKRAQLLFWDAMDLFSASWWFVLEAPEVDYTITTIFLLCGADLL